MTTLGIIIVLLALSGRGYSFNFTECYDENRFCFGSRNGIKSYGPSEKGCIKDNNCDVKLGATRNPNTNTYTYLIEGNNATLIITNHESLDGKSYFLAQKDGPERFSKFSRFDSKNSRIPILCASGGIVSAACHGYTLGPSPIFESRQKMTHDEYKDVKVDLTDKLYVHLKFIDKTGREKTTRTGFACKLFSKKGPDSNPCDKNRKKILIIVVLIAIILALIFIGLVIFFMYFKNKKSTKKGSKQVSTDTMNPNEFSTSGASTKDYSTQKGITAVYAKDEENPSNKNFGPETRSIMTVDSVTGAPISKK